MKIVILTLGTRGDIYPYLALALGLKSAGYEVKMVANLEFADEIKAHAIQYAPINFSMRDFLASDTGKGTSFGEGKTKAQAQRELNEKLTNEYWPRILNDIWQGSQDADLLIYTTMLYHAWYIAEALNIPAIISFPSPGMTPTGEFPNPEMPTNLGPVLNRWSFHLLAYLFFSRDRQAVVNWCRDTLQVKPRPWFSNYFHRRGRPVPTLYCYSGCVLPRPRTWGEHVAVSGYWFLDTTKNWQPSAELEQFLASGPAPVYVGFGSTVNTDAEKTTHMVISALEQAKQRGIISSGWGSMINRDLPDSIHCVDYVPYEWLFPQVSAVVHHGGAGIVGTALLYGKPAVACPFLPEQLFWGRLLDKRRIGSPPVPQKPQQQFTADRLAAAIKTVTEDSNIRHNAEQVGRCLQQEDGVKNAIEFIEQQFDLWQQNKAINQ